ncbi:hypothetical protein ABIA35_003515 [Catenulispora sp. MAP12-49]
MPKPSSVVYVPDSLVITMVCVPALNAALLNTAAFVCR